jgi:type IV pilus assembly protein PilX
MSEKRRIGVRTGQAGAVLVTGLLFLLVMSLLGVTAMNVALLEEKMAGNLRDRSVAFQAAETALRSVEAMLAASADIIDASAAEPCRSGWYERISCPLPAVLTDDFWQRGSVGAATGELAHVALPPQYVVERLDCYPWPLEKCDHYPFRVTVRASGGSAAAVVMLQAVYLLTPGDAAAAQSKFLGRQSWRQLR